MIYEVVMFEAYQDTLCKLNSGYPVTPTGWNFWYDDLYQLWRIVRLALTSKQEFHAMMLIHFNYSCRSLALLFTIILLLAPPPLPRSTHHDCQCQLEDQDPPKVNGYLCHLAGQLWRPHSAIAARATEVWLRPPQGSGSEVQGELCGFSKASEN